MNTELEAANILTPKELAKRLKVPLTWIYEKSRARGQFAGEPMPVLRVGKYLRFDWKEVTAWLRSNNGGR